MPSYVVTGASRGLGFTFIDKLSSNPNNVVIGFVRNHTAAAQKLANELPDRSNLHLVEGDLDSYDSLQNAVQKTSAITGGSLDCLIGNAGVSSSSLESLSELGSDPGALEKDVAGAFHTNVIGNINLINLAMPLIQKGEMKKVAMLSTGLADIELTAKYELFESPSYAISKAALDMVIAKYHAEYNSQNILIMGISPGVVDTGNAVGEAQKPGGQERLGNFFQKFVRYAPHFKGPDTAETSVNNVMAVLESATVQNNGGRVVSHLGTRQWL